MLNSKLAKHIHDKLLIRLADEKLQYFLDRTNKHIGLVQQAAKRIVEVYPEFAELIEIAYKHDASKFIEPELTPYVAITWNKKRNNYFNRKELQDNYEATLHHVKNNKHHPEYWNKSEANINLNDRDKSDKCIDASKMEDTYVAEMIADWQAMSEELGTNTTREWFDKQKNIRWKFSKHQEDLIDKLLKVFE